MKNRLSAVLILLVTAVLISCSASSDGSSDFARLTKSHPRLILTPEVRDTLRTRIKTTHRWLWERCKQDIPSRLRNAKKGETGELDRAIANNAQELAFLWTVTGEQEHYQAARDHLLAIASSDPWPPENDLIHGHLLQGMALAYDWLYPQLTQSERSTVAGRLKQEAANEYERMTTGRVWYRNQYYQNHGISNFCGLAFAAAALWGEDEQAGGWLDLCNKYMDFALREMPADGTSLEGISYGAYDFEFLIRYVELARKSLELDYTGSDGLRNFPRWVLHSMLPVQRPDEWAMTFGDAPRHAGWHGPEAQLFWCASHYGDSTAQWLGRHLIELEPEGLGSASWWSLLFYDDETPEIEGPAGLPTFHHFTENDQVMMRSGWDDPQATLVGLKAGPFMGRTRSGKVEWDWGTNHQHPDAGSFQLFSHGAQLAIDPLYTIFKRGSDHNLMLFKGQGQLGEDIPWMGTAECLALGHYPQIVHTENNTDYDYVVADLARAYHPDLGAVSYTHLTLPTN